MSGFLIAKDRKIENLLNNHVKKTEYVKERVKVMTYTELKDCVVDTIKDYLPDEYMDADVKINQILKNNETLDGLVITMPGQNVAPTIYLEDFYENYKDGRDIEDILDAIADIQVTHASPDILNDIGFSASDVTNYEMVKERLTAHVVGVEGNEELLAKRPHVIKEDMAIMYKIALSDEMSIPITNELFSGYGVSIEDFHEKAMQNVSEHVMVQSLSETIMGMMNNDMFAIPPEKDMIIITNESKFNGAIGIFDNELMESLSEKYGNYIVMPSSVHECLLVPEIAGLSVKDAREMVEEVNNTQVAPQDRLTYSVYMFDKDAHEIRMCRDDQELIQEKQVGLANEMDKELYRDDNILISENENFVSVANISGKDISVYAENLADVLDDVRDEPIIVLYGDDAPLMYENTDRGFTGEILDALKQDIRENNLRSEPLSEDFRKIIERDDNDLVLA